MSLVRVLEEAAANRLPPGSLPSGSRKVPGQGFLLLLFPLSRNFTPLIIFKP